MNLSREFSFQKNRLLQTVFLYGLMLFICRRIVAGYPLNKILILGLLVLGAMYLYVKGIHKASFLLVLSAYMHIYLNLTSIPNLELFELLMPVVVIIFVLQNFTKKWKLKRLPKASIPLLLYFGIMLLYYFQNPGLPRNLLGLKGGTSNFRPTFSILLLLLLYYFTPLILTDKRQVRGIITAFFLIYVSLFLISFSMFLMDIDSVPFLPSYSQEIHRVTSDQGAWIRFGVLGESAYALSILFLAFYAQKYKRFQYVVFAICAYAILQSGGRATLIGFLVSVGLFLYFTNQSKKLFLIISLAICGFVALWKMPYLLDRTPAQVHRMLAIFTGQDRHFDVYGPQSRMHIFMLLVQDIKENPFIGHGPPQGTLAGTQATFAEIAARAGTHTTYLSIAAIYGLPALMLYLTAVIGYFKRIIRVYRTSEDDFCRKFSLWIMLFLGASLIRFLFGGSARGGGSDFYLILGLVGVAQNLSRRREQG